MVNQAVLVAGVFFSMVAGLALRNSIADEGDGVVSISDQPINPTNSFVNARTDQAAKPVVILPPTVGNVTISDRPINPTNILIGPIGPVQRPTVLTTYGGTVSIHRQPINPTNRFPNVSPGESEPPTVLEEAGAPPLISIRDGGANVFVKVEGGSGLYQLEGKTNLNQTTWAPIGVVTTDTSIVYSKNAGFIFLRATAAPSAQ